MPRAHAHLVPAALFVLSLASGSHAGPLSSSNRAYTAGKVALELGGKVVGWPHSASGGSAYADVAESAGGRGSPDKRLGATRYDEVALQVSGMDASFWAAVNAGLERGTRTSGAIIYADATLTEHQRLVFSEALITEFGVPPLDAASKEPGFFSVRLLPTRATRALVDGARLSQSGPKPPWTLSAFRLRIDGLDTTKVAHIDSFAIRAGAVREVVSGDMREAVVEPGKRSVSDLVFTVATSHAKSIADWHAASVTDGKPTEKNGTLELLGPSGQVMYGIDLTGLGIYRLDMEKTDSSSESISRMRASLYVENARLRVP